MNGLCYLIPSDLQIANIRKLPALVGASKRTAKTSWGEQVYNYGMAGMGGSLHVTKEVHSLHKCISIRYFKRPKVRVTVDRISA